MNYLYWLGHQAWDGSSGVLEVGPWLGGSTWCLASGIEDNPRRLVERPLHVVDNFVWRPFMAERASLPIPVDSSFRPEFEKNLKAKESLMVVHEALLPDDSSGDLTHEEPVRSTTYIPLLSESELPAEIGIAFVDGAKSLRGFTYLMRLLSRRCVPGRTLIAFQDFKSWACYWIPLGVAAVMEVQPEAIAIVHVLRHNTVTVKVQRPMSLEALEHLPADIASVSLERGLALVDSAAQAIAELGDQTGALTAKLAGVSFLGARGEWDAAVERFEGIDRTWPWFGQPVSPLASARRWLEAHTGAPLAHSHRAQATRAQAALSSRLRESRKTAKRRHSSSASG